MIRLNFFLDKIQEISSPNYLPSQQDIIRSRIRTTGICESVFIIDDLKYRIFDVGGQRNERKKWIHCFDNVTAILFVASLSEYDQVLFEDSHTNRLIESLMLFDQVVNGRWFMDSSIILFLNKSDLFADKISRAPLSVCFPEYEGSTYDEAKEFIKNLFLSKNSAPDKTVYVHFTCATDTENIKKTFSIVQSVVVRQVELTSGVL